MSTQPWLNGRGLLDTIQMEVPETMDPKFNVYGLISDVKEKCWVACLDKLPSGFENPLPSDVTKEGLIEIVRELIFTNGDRYRVYPKKVVQLTSRNRVPNWNGPWV